jgi:hypothetical protein
MLYPSPSPAAPAGVRLADSICCTELQNTALCHDEAILTQNC